MPLKKEIQVVLHSPLPENQPGFQKMVNEIFADMVGERLRNGGYTAERACLIIEKLVEVYCKNG